MSLAHSPGVVTNGLQFYYDMANTQKSFKGQPTTNWFGIPTPDSSSNVTFPVQGTGTFQRIYAGTYGGYTIQPTDIVYKYVLGLAPTGCHYHGNTISVTTGQTPTWSFDYYIDGSTTGYPVTNYLANMESSVGVGLALTDPTPTSIGVWKRVTGTSAAATSNGTFNAYLYPGACGTQMATGGFILYKNPQVELNSFATQFTTSTRSTTQACIDLMSNSTITATSLTYNSDGTHSFNGSSNYATIANALSGGIYTPFTLMAVAKTATASGWQTVIGTAGTLRQIGFSGAAFYYGGNGGGGNTFVNGGSITANTWYHMAFTFDGATAYGYLNGIQTTGSIGSNGGTIGNNILGSYNGGAELLNGSIGLAKIYNRPLTAAEVQQNFNAVRGRFGI